MSLEETVHNAEPYLYPFEMEFCLTAVGLLFIMMTKRMTDNLTTGMLGGALVYTVPQQC